MCTKMSASEYLLKQSFIIGHHSLMIDALVPDFMGFRNLGSMNFSIQGNKTDSS
jgi:hypothetical protein